MLATMFYGRANRQPEVIARAIRHYGKALPSLRHDLLNPDGMSYGSLVSAATLTMYEVSVGSVTVGLHFADNRSYSRQTRQ